MVKIEVVHLRPVYSTVLMFVCPTVDRAKEVVNEGGFVAGRRGPVDNDTGWRKMDDDIWVSTVESEDSAFYAISPVEYIE